MWIMFITGLAAGIAATPHCFGMCGGFPLFLAKSSTGRSVLPRQLLFILAKSFTYVFLGVIASAAGMIVFKNTRFAVGGPYLRLAAGFITVLFGLAMLGLKVPALNFLRGTGAAGFIQTTFGSLLGSAHPLAPFTIGLFAGFIPCPLPMALLAVAAASHNILHGSALMAGLGLGTAPGLIAAGLLGVGLDRRFAKYGMRVAGALVLVLGLLTVCRTSKAILGPHAAGRPIPSCCQDEAR